MVLWEIFAIAGLAFLILEMIVPSMFFFKPCSCGVCNSSCCTVCKRLDYSDIYICSAFNSFYSFVKTNFD